MTILILKCKEDLIFYHFDSISMGFFILFGALFSIFTLPVPIFLFIKFRKFLWEHEKPLLENLKYFLLCALGAFLTIISFAVVRILIDGGIPAQVKTGPIDWVSFLTQIEIQMSNAAIFEEPIFRGFLWGYLLKRGWKEKYVLLSTAGLFWIAHITQILNDPLQFWTLTPIFCLLIGWVVMKTRSLASSMIFHATANATTYIAYSFAANYLLHIS